MIIFFDNMSTVKNIPNLHFRIEKAVFLEVNLGFIAQYLKNVK